MSVGAGFLGGLRPQRTTTTPTGKESLKNSLVQLPLNCGVETTQPESLFGFEARRPHRGVVCVVSHLVGSWTNGGTWHGR